MRQDFDLDAFLEQPLVARLATAGPTIRPVWFLWEEDAFWWLTGSWSAVEQQLVSDPGVAIVIDTCDLTTGEIKQVRAKALPNPTRSIASYVNINTPVRWDDARAVSVDLDLDVVEFVDGHVEIVDQDEFARHQRSYAYPPWIIAGAERAAATAHDLVCRGEPPFDGVRAQSWAARALSSTLAPPTMLPSPGVAQQDIAPARRQL